MKDLSFLNILENVYLKFRYMFFRKYITKKSFANRKLVFSDDFKNLDNFKITDNEFYNDNDVYFSKDAVKIVDNGVRITCYKDKATRTTWQGKRTTNWTSGMITTHGKFQQSKGVWVIESNICASWPAIWMLKYERLIEGYKVKQITPEIDLMEIINGKIQHGIAYGYSDITYRTNGVFNRIIKNDDAFHEFAVEILDNGYRFYLDGILTAKFNLSDPEFVSNDANYLLLNNAADEDTVKNTTFIIKSVKVYE